VKLADHRNNIKLDYEKFEARPGDELGGSGLRNRRKRRIKIPESVRSR
jgi:hypothetical protein